MNGSELPIAQEDLHAYVDGQLTPTRRAAVQRYLQANPEEARRVAAWTAQRDRCASPSRTRRHCRPLSISLV